MFFYSDLSVKGEFTSCDFSRINSTKKSLEHYSNLLTLQFFLKNPKDLNEKQQVLKEITICERKIKWWSHQGNFSQVDFVKGCEELKRKWR